MVQLIELQENRALIEKSDGNQNKLAQIKKIKIEKKKQKLGSNLLVVVVKSLDYLDPQSDFKNLLRVNKLWYEKLGPKLIKRYILNWRIKMSVNQRKLLWQKKYDLRAKDLDYEALLK